MWAKSGKLWRWLRGGLVVIGLWALGWVSPPIHAAPTLSYTSITSGNWSNPSTWDMNTVPNGSTDSVTIAEGMTVQVDGTFEVMALSVMHAARLDIPASSTLTAGFVSNQGRIAMTHPVNGGTVAFQILNASSAPSYRMVDITPASTALGNVTVVVRGLQSGEYCPNTDASSPDYTRRCFDITPTTSAAATVRLWVTSGERNGLAAGVLKLYRGVSPLVWSQINTNTASGTADSNAYYYVEATTPGFSSFLSGGPTAPTAITLTSFTATAGRWEAWLWLAGLALVGVGVWVWRRRFGNW